MGYSYIIEPFLLQGSFPSPGTDLSGLADVLVLCAYELQPPASVYPGITVLHVPLDDTLTPTPQEVRLALDAGKNVAMRLQRGEKMLVTCAQGRNRSGLVTGVALLELGSSARNSVRLIKNNRRNALTNHTFVHILELHDQNMNQKAA